MKNDVLAAVEMTTSLIKLKILEWLDGQQADKIINAVICWHNGHEWDTVEECESCIVNVCERCGRYGGTTKGRK